MIVRDVASAVLLLSGALFCLVGAIGLVRLPDVLSRLQAATKPQTVGLLLVLAGAAVRLEPRHAAGLLLVVMFQVITAPVLSQLFGKAAYHTGAVSSTMLVTDELDERLRKEGASSRDASDKAE